MKLKQTQERPWVCAICVIGGCLCLPVLVATCFWHTVYRAIGPQTSIPSLAAVLLPCGISYNVVFVESKWFTRRLRELAGEEADDVLRTIQTDLLASPARGRIVPGLGGIRKGRCANPHSGKGKRGGYRHLYLFLARKDRVHLLFLLDKDEQEDLTPAERAILRQLVAEIKRA